MKKILMTAAAALSLGLAVTPAQALVIGTTDSTNGIPLGNNGFGYYFQQVYSAASFASPLSIDLLSFYDATGTPRTGNFDIYLSTTSAAVSTFDTNTVVPWLDASFTQVFSGPLPSVGDGRLDLNLSSVFNYDPSAGNLLLTIRSFDLGSGALLVGADKNVGVTNSRFSAYPYDWNQGLVTGFNDRIAAVPEPATWATMILGAAGAGAMIRRRRAAQRFA